MESVDPWTDTTTALERSMSQHSTTSVRSYRSNTARGGRKCRRVLASQAPSSRASSIAPSDKSLTSFPSFSPEGSPVDNHLNEDKFKTATQKTYRQVSNEERGRSESIVDSLAGIGAGRKGLFDDAPLTGNKAPGALHQADDAHIQRLISRHGAVGLVRQIAEDLAERDSQISTMRRRADERERALRRIIRDCGLSNMELENKLRSVEEEFRANGKTRCRVDSGLSDLMHDAMQDTLSNTKGGVSNGTAIRVSSAAANNSNNTNKNDGKGTAKGWKEYLWGSSKTSRGSSVAPSINGVDPSAPLRSQSSLSQRPTLRDDLFNPPVPAEPAPAPKSSSRASSVHSSQLGDRKTSGSLASFALRLVAGGAISTREQEFQRGRAGNNTAVRAGSVRGTSAASNHTSRSARAVSVQGGPKALMAMRRSTPVPQGQPTTKSQSQGMWETMVGSPSGNESARQESYGPVEMDSIRPPEDQPPTLTHIYNNYPNGEFLTDRFGFIYDQRRKKRQREAAQMAKRMRSGSKGSKAEMLMNGRAGISPNMLEDVPSPKWSNSSDGRPGSPSSLQDALSVDEGKPRRWQDYLKIATVPTELLSHTPSMGAPSLEVLDGAESTGSEPTKSPSITPTESGLIPVASTTTAIDSEITQPSEPETGTLVKEDVEPVKLLLEQLSEVHDSLQREKTPKWNDFLRKVRAERRKEGEAAVAAANAVAEARYERPAVILPETRVADGEIIGIAGLGNKGKVGRAKWNEFKTLVLSGIPVAYRPKVWSECSGATAMRIPGYYEELVNQEGKDDDASVISQIQMDIHRTLTDNIFFRRGPGVQKLNEVLVAYSRRNKGVGYCQGMNLIAANLLLIMPSTEDAFWLLTTIIENILPQGYYSHNLASSRADQQVLRQYVSTVLPRLSAHLDSLSIELEALTFQWFLSVFTDCLCAEALFRVWDVVLCGAPGEGSTFLFQVALALLKLNEKNLIACDTAAGVYTYISHHMTEHAISIDGLMQASEGLRKVVKREEVEAMRERAIRAEAEAMEGEPELVAADPMPIIED